MNVDLSSLSKLLGHLTLESVLSSLLTLLVCLIVIKILSRLLQRILRRTQLDERLQKFLLSGLRILGYIVTVIIVAQSLGIPSTSLVALLSVASLAVSLAVQGLLSNVAGGMMLLTSRPISLGDYVEVAGVTGYVDEIGMVYTKLHTDDGQVIMLPNSSISGERITNYSTLGRRRIVLSIGVSYDAAVPEVRTALLEAAASIETLLDDPAPVVYVTAYQESCIEYTIYCWCVWDVFLSTKLKLNEAVKRALDQHHIEIPYNYLNVRILDGSAAPPDGQTRA
ncbi:mechanosensitive ion channel family protein [bacterium 210917-DFI.7.65]|nr:mechanosensitive ion channel family protein [Clostridiales bacterium]MCB6900120.1 mechanosensitive ion channel family protein [bacterium 210917-DFI.7.65]